MNSDLRDLKMKEEILDFGFGECGRLTEGKPVTVVNQFPFPVQVNWVLRRVVSHKTGLEYENPFRFFPSEAVIPPHETVDFEVKFAPYEPDSYFFQEAQCFIQLLNGMQNKVKKLTMAGTGGPGNFKGSMRATKTLLGSLKNTRFQEALNEELDPPACLKLRAVGHSFPPGSQVFIPMIKISPSNKVTFAPAGVNESVY